MVKLITAWETKVLTSSHGLQQYKTAQPPEAGVDWFTVRFNDGGVACLATKDITMYIVQPIYEDGDSATKSTGES